MKSDGINIRKDQIKKDLIKILGRNNVFTEKSKRLCYRFGNVIQYRLEPPSFVADFVVQPFSTEQISSILKLANKYKVPVVPWGGGTDFTGANSPINGGIVLDMKNFDKVEVNKQEYTLTAGAGATLSKLSEEADKSDLLFPHEITTQQSATIGGAIATDSFGYRSGKYRSIRNLILGIQVILPTGEIIKTKPLFKTSTGYDLASLIIGSEGTLGIATEIDLRLFPKPESREFSTYLFNSFKVGFEAGERIWNSLSPDFFSLGELSFLKYSKNSEIFFIKSSNSKAFQRYIKARYVKSSLSGIALGKILSIIPQTKLSVKYVDNSITKKSCLSILTVGFEEDRKIVKRKKKKADVIALDCKGVKFSDESFYRDRFKSFAKLKEIIIDHFPDQAQNFKLATFDLSLPTGQVVKMKNSLDQLLSKYRSIFILYSELYSSVSTLGFDIIFKEDDKTEYFKFLEDVYLKTTELGGSLSFAHGIGTRFLPYLIKDRGASQMMFMKKIKLALDPDNILNPGKLGDFNEVK
ncbi:MAG: FAD-binding oxidoreductase [Candidatus Hodarchaeales archaeon]|jgi:glycolate oxidase